MKKMRCAALALALTLLTACGGMGQPGGDQALKDDLSYQAAGLRKDQAVAQVNGDPITAEEYLFWLANAVMMQQYYAPMETEEDWTQAAGDMKADALEAAKLYRLIESKAAEYGAELTVEMETAMADELAQAIETQGGEENFEAYLDSMCISREGFEKLNKVYYYNQALMAKLTEAGELTPPADEVDNFVKEYLETNNCYGAKHILIATRRQLEDGSYEEYSEEEKEKAYQLALNLRERLLEENDSEEVFDELMKEFSEDGRDENGDLYAPGGYTLVFPADKVTSYGQMAMVPEFEAGALALEIGQVGDIVATDYGYHIIMRIPVDDTSVREYAQAQVNESYMMNKLTQKWLDEAQVTVEPVYETIDPRDFYEKLTALNEELHPADQTPAPTESGN